MHPSQVIISNQVALKKKSVQTSGAKLTSEVLFI
jgi:hypothetical protein